MSHVTHDCLYHELILGVYHADVVLRFRAAAFAEKSEYCILSGRRDAVRLEEKRFFSP